MNEDMPSCSSATFIFKVTLGHAELATQHAPQTPEKLLEAHSCQNFLGWSLIQSQLLTDRILQQSEPQRQTCNPK